VSLVYKLKEEIDRIAVDAHTLDPVFAEIVHLYELGLNEEASKRTAEVDKILMEYGKRLRYVEKVADKLEAQREQDSGRTDAKGKKGSR